MKTPSRLRIMLSNLKERLLMALFNLVSRRQRYVIIEGDTTVQASNGEWPVCNAGITLSRRIADEIFDCVHPYENTEVYPDRYYALVSKLTFKDQSRQHWNYCFDLNPELEEYDEHPILSPIQFDQKWHTFGFQPCTPTVMKMLHSWGLSIGSVIVLPVTRSYDWHNHCYSYTIANPSERTFWYPLISWIVLRNTFRFPDKRAK